jgi:hypothetical protein
MGTTGKLRIAAAVLVLAGGAIAPATAAASDASIVAVIERYGPKIDKAEGGVLTAIGNYRQSGKDPGQVTAALGKSIHVFKSLDAKVAKQSAPAGRVRRGKENVEQGLGQVITAYKHLRGEFGKEASPEVAEADGKRLAHEVLLARKDLAKGVKLLTRQG